MEQAWERFARNVDWPNAHPHNRATNNKYTNTKTNTNTNTNTNINGAGMGKACQKCRLAKHSMHTTEQNNTEYDIWIFFTDFPPNAQNRAKQI